MDGVLAACLLAWASGETENEAPSSDAQTGALAVAETINLIRSALKKK